MVTCARAPVAAAVTMPASPTDSPPVMVTVRVSAPSARPSAAMFKVTMAVAGSAVACARLNAMTPAPGSAKSAAVMSAPPME